MTPFHRQLLHLAPERARERELVSLAYFVDRKSIFLQHEAALFVNDARELLGSLELRWAFRRPLEEAFVSQVETLDYFLNALRMHTAHLIALCEVRLHAVPADVLMKQGVITFLKGKAMIPYEARFAQQSVQRPVTLALIQLVLVSYHCLLLLLL